MTSTSNEKKQMLVDNKPIVEASTTTKTDVVYGSLIIGGAMLCLSLFVFLLWTAFEAPPKYINKQLASSEAPECLLQRLEVILERRPLTREDVREANRNCVRAKSQRDGIRWDSKNNGG